MKLSRCRKATCIKINVYMVHIWRSHSLVRHIYFWSGSRWSKFVFIYIYIFWETEPNKFVRKYQRVVQTKITSEIGQSFCRSGWDWSEYCYLKLQWTQFMLCLGDIEDTNLQQFSITISIFLVSYIMKLKKDNVI